MYTERVTEDTALLDVQSPDDRGAGTHNGAWVNMALYPRAIMEVFVGDMAAGATLDAGIQQATDAAGTGAKAIAGKTITQLTQAGGDVGANVAIELQSEELDVDGGFNFVRLYTTTAVGTVIHCAALKGVGSRFKPVPTTNYTEIVG